MAFDSEFLFEGLTDFWDNLREVDRNVVLSIWDATLKMAADLTAEILQTDQAKSLRTVPVTFKTLFVPFVFSDRNRNTTATPPAGFDVDAFDVDPLIVSIPKMLDATVNDPEFKVPSVFEEGTDYQITNGVVFWAVTPPGFTLAPQVLEDRRLIEKNFGAPVGLFGASSERFLSKVRGAWFALWSGPTIDNVELVVAIPLGLPFAEPGRIISVTPDGQGGSDVVVEQTIDGRIVTINVPAPLGVTVTAGEIIENFRTISDAISISDLITDPGFAERFGLGAFAEFFTFVPVVDGNVVAQLFAAGQDLDFEVASQLLEKIKPAYTDTFIGIDKKQADELDMVLFTEEDRVRFDATASLNMNYVNWMAIPAFEADPANLDEDTYKQALVERREYDIGEDTIAIRDRFIVKDLDTGAFLAGDDPPVGYGINYGASYGG